MGSVTDRCPNCGRFVENDAAGYYDRLHPDDEESEIVVFCDEACSERHRQQRAAAMGSRAVEALTLDCPEPEREVPAQRIREAVEGVIRQHQLLPVRPGVSGAVLLWTIRCNTRDRSREATDAEVDHLVDRLTLAVVKVLGGEA